jgi:hypothetical protein
MALENKANKQWANELRASIARRAALLRTAGISAAKERDYIRVTSRVRNPHRAHNTRHGDSMPGGLNSMGKIFEPRYRRLIRTIRCALPGTLDGALACPKRFTDKCKSRRQSAAIVAASHKIGKCRCIDKAFA